MSKIVVVVSFLLLTESLIDFLFFYLESGRGIPTQIEKSFGENND